MEPSAPRPTSDQSLRDLMDADWEWRLREYPTLATSVGDSRYDDRWTDLSLPAFDRRAAYQRDLLRRVEAIDRAALSPASCDDYDLFLYEARQRVEGLRFPDELMPLTHMHGVHQDVADLLQIAPCRTRRDYDNIVARLLGVGLLVDQSIVLMREGAGRRITPPRVILESVPALVALQTPEKPEDSPISSLLLADLPADWTDKERVPVRRDILEAVRSVVIPAYRRLHAYVSEEYVPQARTTLGMSALPDGAAWYAHLVRLMTSLDMEPATIHAIGVEEVGRLKAAMLDTRTRSGFGGSLSEFFDFLRTDGRFFYDSAGDMLSGYRDICARIDGALPRLFRTLPRLPYEVRAVPSYSEKVQTTAYYNPGSPDVGRPGYFFVNTYDLRSRPKWEMEALAAHEAVPGHHLQIALAQELADRPAFRRHGHQTAYVEGWGLYAESIGADLGLYRDPYSDFGRLTYAMWRAIRLVIDTGLHALGWTRPQSIAYFEEHAGKASHDIAVEVDRYLAWPAQALAYKLGEREITSLRDGARRALGERFDVREFHEVVLGGGPLPLQILETRVNDWIARVASGPTA